MSKVTNKRTKVILHLQNNNQFQGMTMGKDLEEAASQYSLSISCHLSVYSFFLHNIGKGEKM